MLQPVHLSLSPQEFSCQPFCHIAFRQLLWMIFPDPHPPVGLPQGWGVFDAQRVARFPGEKERKRVALGDATMKNTGNLGLSNGNGDRMD
jgi:hypothetical protein